MRFTEIKRVRYDDGCKDNPVFLRWLNTLDGWNYWLFSRNQIISVLTSNEITFENPVENLETAEEFVSVLSVYSGKEMFLGANALDRNDIEFVKSILYSPKVQWLFNGDTWEADGECKWVTVIPHRGTFPTVETREERTDISLTLKFPEIRNQNL